MIETTCSILVIRKYLILLDTGFLVVKTIAVVKSG
jgi:hypothetical protein